MGIPIDTGMSIICIAIFSPLFLQATGMKVSPFRSECFSYRFAMGLIIARSVRSVNQNFQDVYKRQLLILIVLLALLSNVLVVTHSNEYQIVQQFGKIVSVRDQAGLSFKIPFVSSVRTLPKTVLLYDLPISDVITRDKKTMVADSFVLWKITDPVSYTHLH